MCVFVCHIQVMQISRVIWMCVVHGIQTHDLEPHANLSYHLTYIAHVIEWEMLSF